MVLWTPGFKFQFCVQWVLAELCAVTVCTASVNLTGISGAVQVQGSAQIPAHLQLQSHSSAHPGCGAGVPQSSWAQHWSPRTWAGLCGDSHHTHLQWSNTQGRLRALCGSTAHGRQHQVHTMLPKVGLWAWSLLLL